MNFDMYRGEITIYPSDCVDVNEEEIVQLWENSEENICFVIDSNYELKSNDDGYGRIVYSIEKRVVE